METTTFPLSPGVASGRAPGVKRAKNKATMSRNSEKINVRVASVNVGSMAGRSREVVEMLGRRRVDVCAVQEVRYKNSGTRVYGSGEEKYKFWWSGGEKTEEQRYTVHE